MPDTGTTVRSGYWKSLNRSPGDARASAQPGRTGRDRGGRDVIPLHEIEAARDRIAGAGAIRTPLIRLHEPDAPAEIWLKLENLQPINSFKLRGALNAILSASAEARADGLVTA